MRNLNRVIAAGALVVPMALGASGVAMAAAGSSALPTQIVVSEDDGSHGCDDSGHCDDSRHCGDGDDGDSGLGILEILFGESSRDDDCEEDRDRGEDDGDDDNGSSLIG